MLNETEKKQDQIIRACIDDLLHVALFKAQQSQRGIFEIRVNSDISRVTNKTFLGAEFFDDTKFQDLEKYQTPPTQLTSDQQKRGFVLHSVTLYVKFVWTHENKTDYLQFTRDVLAVPNDMFLELPKTETPTPPTVDYDTLNRFVVNVQKFNVTQFNARTNALIQTFGEDKGIEFSERLDKYGLWYFIHSFNAEQRNRFFDLVLGMKIENN